MQGQLLCLRNGCHSASTVLLSDSHCSELASSDSNTANARHAVVRHHPDVDGKLFILVCLCSGVHRQAPLLVQVELALNILDGAPFREDPKQVIHVQRAKFEQKGQDYVPKKKPKSKKKVAGVLSKQEKELGWGGFDDKLAANKVSFAPTCPVYQACMYSLHHHNCFCL